MFARRRHRAAILAALEPWALAAIGLLAACRGDTSADPPLHLNLNMDHQAYLEGQERSDWFADQRAMRPQVEGTIARGELRDGEHRYRGMRRGAPAQTLPLRLDRPLLARGRQRVEIHCAPCHGLTGEGRDAPMRQTTNALLVPPPSYLADRLLALPVGQIFTSISDGVRNMPAHRERIPVDDRWAIVAHVRVLQIAGTAPIERVPAALARQKGWTR